MIPRYFVVAESGHELQNPTSKEKILELGERIGLGPESGCSTSRRGGVVPRSCSQAPTAARSRASRSARTSSTWPVERIEAAGLSERVSFRLGDASQVALPSESYDVALCLGASFVWGDLARTLDALEPAVRPRGHVVVGEPFWRRLPLPDDYEDSALPCTTLEGTVGIFETGGLVVTGVIASSDDDWDRYETLHWRAVEAWLAENPDDPDAADIRARHERLQAHLPALRP